MKRHVSSTSLLNRPINFEHPEQWIIATVHVTDRP